ncbi:sigma-70 family RNA polymerase sigma factor [Tundrisphaera sp. TA3]|uniref:sigma-70 family RNA polymerase sigma factor n=1 Tax=Tundrisphaera sp. TA3 TaxID=3435775 RepID=UPI003EBEBB7B
MAGAGLGAADRHLRELFGGASAVGLSDGQLLARYASTGDDAAFEALVGRHGPMVLATCRAILRDEHDVEDAFQATFLVLARKAGTVRGGEALGGWLHRVARRSAVQAGVRANRRRRKEAEASALAPTKEARPEFDPDLRAILHQEIDRLPEAQRLAVVLCDLEGLTYEQAAGQLRWTVPAFRCRLSRARQRLRTRLTRRGITATTLAAWLADSTASAFVVPAALMRASVAAAGGTTSAGVLALTRSILRGMLMTKIHFAATAALAALALATAGVFAVAARPEGPEALTMPAAQAPEPAPARPDLPPAEAARPDEPIPVRGTVVGPDGRPVAGARVRLAESRGEIPPDLAATTGPDGRFALQVPRSLREANVDIIDRFPRLVATAPGFAPGWAEGVLRGGAPSSPTIRLAEAGPPIEGRVVDLEGRPVAGARVATTDLYFSEAGDLGSWIASVRLVGVRAIWRELGRIHIDSPEAATTDAEGRFRIDGPGRDRIAVLLLSGPGIAAESLHVMGRDDPEVRTVDKSWVEPRPFLIHPRRFQHVAAPSRPIEGTIRDRDTGRPIAGVLIRGNIVRDGDNTWIDGVEARTDADGRYRLEGLPAAASYRLFLFPGRGVPYANAALPVPAPPPGPGPIAFDVALKRGTLVRGKVTDRATGKPVPGVLNALAFADNPHVRDFPGYSGGYPTRAPVEDDGRFEVVALPGRGIITFRASNDSAYRGGVGADAIPGIKSGSNYRYFSTVPEICNPTGYHLLAGVDLAPGSESFELDLQVDPGRSIAITAVDPGGHPLPGTTAQGLGGLYPIPRPQEAATFEALGYDPARPRRVTIVHIGRKLAGSAYLKGDPPDAVTVRLQPWGEISGRVVDDEGRPRPGMQILSLFGGPGDRAEARAALRGVGDATGDIATDIDGRFRVQGLLPGLEYGASLANSSQILGTLFDGLVVAPGEARDLGDLKVQPGKDPAE